MEYHEKLFKMSEFITLILDDAELFRDFFIIFNERFKSLSTPERIKMIGKFERIALEAEVKLCIRTLIEES